MICCSTRAFQRQLAGVAAAVLLSAGWAAPALAQRADRDAPMHVEADALRFDDAQQTSVFTGNVVLTQGSLMLRGQQLQVRQDPAGFQFGTLTGSAAQPAFFRQKRDGLDEHIEGQALRIDYDSQADTLRLSGQAVLRRFRGASLSDQTSGGVIFLDNRQSRFTVDAGPDSRTPENPGGRVRATISPNPDPNRPAAAPAPVPLQPSPRLEPRQ